MIVVTVSGTSIIVLRTSATPAVGFEAATGPPGLGRLRELAERPGGGAGQCEHAVDEHAGTLLAKHRLKQVDALRLDLGRGNRVLRGAADVGHDRPQLAAVG